MDHFTYRGGILHAEDIDLPRIAREVGTPVYVYSHATLQRHARIFREALAPIARKQIAFAVKANPNLAVLRILAQEGYGADIVSGGELERAIAAGIKPSNIIFSGVGKQRSELHLGLERNIGQFNIEHEPEGIALGDIAAAQQQRAKAVLRVNPDIDAGTHEKISTGKADNKFGVALEQTPAIYARLAAHPGLEMRGLALHIGSQLTSLAPFEISFQKIGRLMMELRSAGHHITHVDLGGGLGVPYRAGDKPPSPAQYGAMVARITRDWDVTLTFEPGRVIAGNSGILLTQVLWIKPSAYQDWVIVDAAMNDLARPALYDAYHDFVAVQPTGKTMLASVVGPVCETGDTFARHRKIDRVASSDLAAFRTAGAYGATMASTYNSRSLVPEVLVNGGRYAIVANRIAASTIMAAEHIPDWDSI